MEEAKDSESGVSISKLPEYLRESVAELKKVTSPTRAETIQATLVTMLIMVFVSVSLFLMDLVFGRIINSLIVPGGS